MANPRIVLCGISPAIAGRQWQTEDFLRVGRLDTLEVYLNDPSISRRHAEVLLTERGWMVHDLGSTNGTYLNAARVGRTDRKLCLNDVLQCGNLALAVSLLEEEVAPSLRGTGRQIPVEASARRSWEEALELFAGPPGRAPGQANHLLTLLRAGYHHSHATTLNELLLSILEDAVSILDAQGGALVLLDPRGGLLSRRAVALPEGRLAAGKFYSQALTQRAFNQSESLLCRDVREGSLQADMGLGAGMASVLCVLLRSPRRRLGVLHLDRGPGQKPFTPEDLALADAIAAGVSVGIESTQAIERQRELFLQTIAALAHAVDVRDHYTGMHTQRVTAYALMLADELRLSPGERQQIHLGTPLHDVGKIGIDDRVLGKPGRLTAEEFEHMKSHTLLGAAILETIPDLTPLLPIVRNHHERWDGSGYPDRLAGERISPLARVVAVADVFDALTSERPYHSAMPLDEAFALIRAGAGSHFDPDCAATFLRLQERVKALVAQELSLKQLAQLAPGTAPARPALRLPGSFS